MKIALHSIFILIFAAPGIVFRRFYYTEEFSKQYFKSTIYQSTVSAIFPAIIIHIFMYVLHLFCDIFGIGSFLQFPCASSLISYLFFNQDNGEAISCLNDHLFDLFKYFISCILIAMTAGIFLKRLVRKLGLDIKYKLFRFQNKWHYRLTGECESFPRTRGFSRGTQNENESNESKKSNNQKLKINDSLLNRFCDFFRNKYNTNIDFLYVDVLVKINDEVIIYDGILYDYELSKDHGLETISLTKARRRLLKDDKYGHHAKTDKSSKTNVYYDIPGDQLIIEYKNVINMNIHYPNLRINKN